GSLDLSPLRPDWDKWRPGAPTSPHWYTAAQLRALIGGFLTLEHAGGRRLSVRAFLEYFDGLKGTRKRKEVFEAARRPGPSLSDLVDRDDVSQAAAERLLRAMRKAARAPKPSELGVLGADNLRRALVEHFGAAPGSVRYCRRAANIGGLPWVLE